MNIFDKVFDNWTTLTPAKWRQQRILHMKFSHFTALRPIRTYSMRISYHLFCFIVACSIVCGCALLNYFPQWIQKVWSITIWWFIWNRFVRPCVASARNYTNCAWKKKHLRNCWYALFSAHIENVSHSERPTILEYFRSSMHFANIFFFFCKRVNAIYAILNSDS